MGMPPLGLLIRREPGPNPIRDIRTAKLIFAAHLCADRHKIVRPIRHPRRHVMRQCFTNRQVHLAPKTKLAVPDQPATFPMVGTDALNRPFIPAVWGQTALPNIVPYGRDGCPQPSARSARPPAQFNLRTRSDGLCASSRRFQQLSAGRRIPASSPARFWPWRNWKSGGCSPRRGAA
jgi:hypothetical protein